MITKLTKLLLIISTCLFISVSSYAIDSDGDGIDDSIDNCPSTYNIYQSDFDHDGIGDVCDPDVDGDGVFNVIDICPMVFNPGQDWPDCEDCPEEFWGCYSCCVGLRGNADMDSLDIIDISDVVAMVDYFFRDGDFLWCFEEIDINGDFIVDIEDLVALVDYSFRNCTDCIAQCPEVDAWDTSWFK